MAELPEIPEIPADLGNDFPSNLILDKPPDASTPRQQKSRDSSNNNSNIPKNPNSIEQWNELIRRSEDKYDNSGGQEDQRKKYASSTSNVYRQLLSRFPFLTESWKQFSIFTYKANGLKESLAVLELATKKHPQSISIWVEYLTALISAGDEFFPANRIDQEFSRAKTQIGYNFHSDPFWDLYISHVSKKDDPKDLVSLYLYLIHIPLYQYAKYYNQFVEMNKTFDVNEIVEDEKHLNKLLQAFDKTNVSELSALEKGQLIDEYANSIFVETQRQVNEKWPYESSLGFQDFQLSTPPDVEPWLRYLTHELDILKTLSDESQKVHHLRFISNLFERTIVPNCFNSQVWLKYCDFTETHLPFDEAKGVYDRAVFNFVPLNEPEVRIKYEGFLMKHEMFDVCNEYLLDLLRLFSGSTGYNIYSKAPYMQTLQQLVSLWNKHVASDKLTGVLENIISGFFDRVDRYKKEPTGEQNGKDEKQYELKQAFITLLSKLLNQDGISVITVAYLKLLEAAGEVVQIRQFFNKYFKEQAFSWSVQFWKFFVDFEGYNQVNLVNLRSIINIIKEKTALPQRAVEGFLEIYHEIVLKNLKSAILLKGPNGEDLHDTLINLGLEKSQCSEANGGK
ncbi:uncharacterized protein CXQ87_002734 [Candidozyma duobushaemuli]|uniref:Suppressor of forked domain-containing protein n=1 Tax=Candidozyma duobushaemuli TaxID=1231522 RepID=A0A2V1A959_9ASCO|nr:uncharacterized protein CXQ87_002734 [[Candida] duobushaemulonis]PVH14589.1 hypothetical protein CXQ87_002734 [[Candida] duobushaemulonis]